MTAPVSITCWSDLPDDVRSSRAFDNLMCERNFRDANPPADDRWSEPDFEEPGTYLSYADDGIDVPYERDELDRLALVGDDGRDAFGELMEERSEPQREVA